MAKSKVGSSFYFNHAVSTFGYGHTKGSTSLRLSLLFLDHMICWMEYVANSCDVMLAIWWH